MSARDNILRRLRAAQPPAASPKSPEPRHMIPLPAMSPQQLAEHFVAAAEGLGCHVYRLHDNELLEQLMELLEGERVVLGWAEDQLPLPGLPGYLQELGIDMLVPAAIDDVAATARVGITGASAALAATGSLVVESGRGRPRASSLLPDRHIALVRSRDILPTLEDWQAAQQARGYPAFRHASNTVIITGPSKTADIGHQLVKGAHGPRELHILLLP